MFVVCSTSVLVPGADFTGKVGSVHLRVWRVLYTVSQRGAT